VGENGMVLERDKQKATSLMNIPLRQHGYIRA
jgi:hypothetical protein